MSETKTLVRVIQSPHDGAIFCRDHLAQIAGTSVLAHEEVALLHVWFWGYRCLMCGVDPVPGRVCENESCKKALHPQWPAVYCCNACALEDL